MWNDRPVTVIIKEMFPVPARIGAISLLRAIVAGILPGCAAAYRPGKWQGRAACRKLQARPAQRFPPAEDILTGEDSTVSPASFHVETNPRKPGITGIYHNSLGLFMVNAAKTER
jgi:hypothetical protein